MAGLNFTSSSTPTGNKALNGGLNSTAGALELQDNESSDLQNVDFDKFGSIIKRSGYTVLAAGDTSSGLVAGDTGLVDGLHWYEWNNAGTTTRQAIRVSSGKMYKMDTLDGTWDDITGPQTITPSNHCDFENFLNTVYVTNGVNIPFKWAGAGTSNVMAVPTGLTSAKFVKQFNNYLFLANVVVSGVYYPSRIYWSNVNDTTTWGGDQWIEVSHNDGQEITGIKVLNDRLVVYKHRSIYNVFFTGDADIPFIMPGGGKSNSTVGCIAPFSIQEVENGHVFLAADGLYYYDGSNSYKLSYRISKTLDSDMNTNLLNNAVSTTYKAKNKYMLALSSVDNTNHNRIIVWDYFNNAFSIYKGINASAMATFFSSGFIEFPYFCDYNAYTYKMETGTDDYPLNVQTAIDFYYYTKWMTFEDLCDQKGVPHVYIYYQSANTVLTFAYSYEFESTDQYTQTMSLSAGTSVYGSAIYGTSTYAGSGGAVKRRDLTGRGRTVRFKFANASIGESVQIDGFGSLAHQETNV